MKAALLMSIGIIVCLLAVLIEEISAEITLENYNKELFKHALVLAEKEHSVWLHNQDLAEENNNCHLFLQKKGFTTLYLKEQQNWDEGGS